MLLRAIIAVTCSVAAYIYTHLRSNTSRIQSLSNLGEVNDDGSCGDGFNKEIHVYPNPESSPEMEEAEEEVKRVSSYGPNKGVFQDSDLNDHMLLPDFDYLVTGGLDFPSTTSSTDDDDSFMMSRRRNFPTLKVRSAIKASFRGNNNREDGGGFQIYESSSEDEEAMKIIEAFSSQVSSPTMGMTPLKGANSDFGEVLDLRMTVSELREKERSMQAELLEYYGLKEWKEESYEDLEKLLKKKTMDIQRLNAKIRSLEEQKARLADEVTKREGTAADLDAAKAKIRELQKQIRTEAGNTKNNLLMLKKQVAALQESSRLDSETEKKIAMLQELENEVSELHRMNMELQHEKQELTVRLTAMDSQITQLSKITQSDLVAEAETVAVSLRHANEDLSRQVEGLQTNRFSEVEELVYLRWVNACLRYEIRNNRLPSASLELSERLSPRSQERAKQLMAEYAGPDLMATTHNQDYIDTDTDSICSVATIPSEYGDNDGYSSVDGGGSSVSRKSRLKKSNIIHKIKKWGSKSKETPNTHFSPISSSLSESTQCSPIPASGNGHKRSNSNGPHEYLLLRTINDVVTIIWHPEIPQNLAPIKTKSEHNVPSSNRLMPKSASGVADEKYPAFQDRHRLALEREQSIKEKAEQARAAEKRKTIKGKLLEVTKVKAPRVPRPPPKPSQAVPIGSLDNFQNAPRVLEFYQSLIPKESGSVHASNAHNSTVGEIENRSSFLLAVKADVETQGDFVMSLATEVRASSYSNIEDVVAFVNWLDEELSFLVDERAVLKHFDWPDSKTDALREAAFEYKDLKKLETEVTEFQDDPLLPCESALKKMLSLLEKVEQSIHALLRTRDMAIARYKEFNIPVSWLSDSGMVGRIKLSLVQLAGKYMNRVVKQLDILRDGTDKEPIREYFLLQGVRFAFRVHQFSGGFDEETMCAFEDLRSRVENHTNKDES